MEKAIREFAAQFSYDPQIENKQNLVRTGKYVLCGMGGSHLQGDVLQAALPGFDLSVHQDYGIPSWPSSVLEKTLVIASSYSGNTEETLSAFEEAKEKGYPVAVIASGGQLIARAQETGAPFIQVPLGLQPRSALGYTFLALLRMVGEEDLVRQAQGLADTLKPEAWEEKGRELAQILQGKIPVIYSSNRNYALAYNWKIKFNETGKIPAFTNLFPELNHNEMTGYAVVENTRELSNKFSFVFLSDHEDHQRVQRRMEVLKEQLEERGFPVTVAEIEGSTRLERVFSSLLLADWTALKLANSYGVDPEQVPMIEEFKARI